MSDRERKQKKHETDGVGKKIKEITEIDLYTSEKKEITEIDFYTRTSSVIISCSLHVTVYNKYRDYSDKLSLRKIRCQIWSLISQNLANYTVRQDLLGMMFS